jgi:hypothetical protein
MAPSDEGSSITGVPSIKVIAIALETVDKSRYFKGFLVWALLSVEWGSGQVPDDAVRCFRPVVAATCASQVFLDPYGNIFESGIPSQPPGTSLPAATYALTGPGFVGAFPPGVTPISIPLNFSELIFRADKFSSTSEDETTEAEQFRAGLFTQPLCAYLNVFCPTGIPPGGTALILCWSCLPTGRSAASAGNLHLSGNHAAAQAPLPSAGYARILPADVEVAHRARTSPIPPAVQQEIDRRKALYPDFHDRDRARIVGYKVGYPVVDKTAKKLWHQSPVPSQPHLALGDYHTHPDRYQARLSVVKLYYQG